MGLKLRTSLQRFKKHRLHNGCTILSIPDISKYEQIMCSFYVLKRKTPKIDIRIPMKMKSFCYLLCLVVLLSAPLEACAVLMLLLPHILTSWGSHLYRSKAPSLKGVSTSVFRKLSMANCLHPVPYTWVSSTISYSVLVFWRRRIRISKPEVPYELIRPQSKMSLCF